MIVHLGLALLVVVNLAFVHVTGVVDSSWVLAFAGLTLLSPLLRKLTDNLAYRVLWNLGVVVLFAGLVQRTLSQGIERMLEGGLVLAAFCQVHLVNNVGSRQRPDLLLFNSFLIALITSFFCQELAYSGIFVIYAFTLLIVWRLLARRGVGGVLAASVVVGDGAKQAAIALLATFAMFLVWPRDFEREGLVGSRILQAAQAQVGFADEIRLSHRLAPVQSDRVVARIRGNDVPPLWRGTTFATLRGGAWHAERVQSLGRGEFGLAWREEGAGVWTRMADTETSTCEVELLDTGGSRLFLPLSAMRLELSAGAANVPHMPLADGTFTWFGDEVGDAPKVVRYQVVLGEPSEQQRQRRPRGDNLVQLELLTIPPQALSTAQELRRGLPADAAPVEIAQALAEYLRGNFSYGLPGQVGSATDLAEFFERRRGHCEFFASALAIMLRSLRVPCRLVGGFLATERDRDGVVVVRARHAHAWVELFDPRHGWVSVDATPSSEAAAEGEGWVDRALAGLRELWTSVTGFDRNRRDAVFAWLLAAPSRLFAAMCERPLLAFAVLALCILWWRRRRRGDADLRQYALAVRRAGLRLAPGETPRQLLARARDANLEPANLAQLVAATNRHERARYAPVRRVLPAHPAP